MFYAIAAVILILYVVRLVASRPDVSPERVQELLAAGGMLIDVRTQPEYRAGHIDSAVNLPLDTLPQGLNRLGVPMGRTLILCCATGMRSAQAKRLLARAGYTSVHNAGAVGRLKG